MSQIIRRKRRKQRSGNRITDRGRNGLSHDAKLMAKRMKVLLAPDQTVALWIKECRRKGREPANLGGYYTADRIDDLVAEAVRFSGRSTGVHWSINLIDPSSVENVNVGVTVGGGAVAADMILRRRWLPIDIDPVRRNTTGTVSATKSEKSAAEELAYVIDDELAESDWPSPVFLDTGNGFCLLYRVDLPTDDGGLVQRVLQRLDREHSNDRAKVDTKVGDPSRVLKIPGTWACKGEYTDTRPHRVSRVLRMSGCGHGVVSEERLRAFAYEPIEIDWGAGAPLDPSVPELVIEDARKYIATMPPAVQGERGHDAALNVAQRIVVGFDIPHNSQQARTLILEWNEQCDPPWTSDELPDLLRKLREADRLATENGEQRGLLRRRSRCDVLPRDPLEGEVIVGEVPDYISFPTEYVRITAKGWESAKSIGMLKRLVVWQQQRSDAVIPDILARQTVWGGRYPRGWLRDLRDMFDPKAQAEERPAADPESDCPPHCPLHRSPHPHRHFPVPMLKNWPVLDAHFSKEALDDDPVEVRQFHFFNREKKWLKKRRECEKANLVRHTLALPVYFGFGRRIGFTRRQARLWLGISGELTRVGKQLGNDAPEGPESGGRHFRADKADVLIDGMVITSGRGRRRIPCPALERHEAYVTFAGNNRGHAGRGYPIVSDDHWCWLDWVGYEQGEYQDDRWGCVTAFLNDLEALSGPLDLVVAARHHERDDWKGLDELQLLPKSGYGREWLEQCRLRVFAPEDFLLQWRYLVAQRLGFRWIPGGGDPPFSLTRALDAPAIADGASLVQFLERHGLSQAGLAEELSVRRETVNRHVQGRSNSSEFWRKVSELAERM